MKTGLDKKKKRSHFKTKYPGCIIMNFEDNFMLGNSKNVILKTIFDDL